MIVIGDVHGHFPAYELLCDRFPAEYTLQLGDMGVGFPDGKCPALGPRDYFFRGNHDNPRAAKHYANHLGDGGSAVLGGTPFFYVPGAWSIDWNMRIEGVSWWRDEELSIAKLTALVEEFADTKPDLVISHDAPEDVARTLLSRFKLKGEPPATTFPTRTGQALQAMLDAHRPKHWIFGHYHTDWKKEIKGTVFQCLNELSWVEAK